MLVSDLVSQYNNSLNSGSKIAKKTKGVEQLSKTVSSLEKGQVFEGTVKRVKGNEVTLSLSSGQNITAKLDKNISLSEGQSVFFQVKSNEGGTVQIRPVNSELGGNPTLLNALRNAGLKETEENYKLVNAMMKEQMPIDKESIQGMIRTMRANPGADIETLVSMKKLDLPINESMITQFENYKESEGAILKMVGELADDFPEAFSGENVTKEDIIAFQNEVLNGILGEDADSMFTPNFSKALTQLSYGEGDFSGMVSENGEVVSPKEASGDGALIAQNKGENAINPETGRPYPPGEAPINNQPAGGNIVSSESVEPGAIRNQNDAPLPKDAIGAVLDKKDQTSLNGLLRQLPGFRESLPNMFDANGNLRPETKGSDVLRALNRYFDANPSVTKEHILSFLDSSPIKRIMNSILSDAWTMEPKELTKEKAVEKLYEKIEEDMERIIQSSKQATHSETNPIAMTAKGVQDNLSFIREVNQIYQYVQIPLQMSGEKTTGDLYVYANKKQKRAENDEITAFLHFDMENLGSTDIAVKLAGKKLDTKFFLDDDISYNLVEQNLHILEERLKDLGYNATLTCENDSNTVNFVEDFLKQDAKSAGDIHRYSFDVRA